MHLKRCFVLNVISHLVNYRCHVIHIVLISTIENSRPIDTLHYTPHAIIKIFIIGIPIKYKNEYARRKTYERSHWKIKTSRWSIIIKQNKNFHVDTIHHLDLNRNHHHIFDSIVCDAIKFTHRQSAMGDLMYIYYDRWLKLTIN